MRGVMPARFHNRAEADDGLERQVSLPATGASLEGTLGNRVDVAEAAALAGGGAALPLADRLLGAVADGDLVGRIDPLILDPAQHGRADLVVGAGERHLAAPLRPARRAARPRPIQPRPPPDQVTGATGSSAPSACTALWNGPLGTVWPFQTASSTRLSAGSRCSEDGRKLRSTSRSSSLRLKAPAGAWFSTTCSGLDLARSVWSPSHTSSRDRPIGVAPATTTSWSAPPSMARAMP